MSRKRPANDAQEAAWIADEDRFVLQQAKKKALLRVKGGRAQPIDWLAVTLAVTDPERNEDVLEDGEEEELELKEPESLFESLAGEKELAELEKGIDGYLGLESSRKNREFWETMKTICADRRQQSQSKQPSARGVSSVAGDLDKLLGPKTLEELEKLERQIKGKLASNEPIDTDYWEHLLRTLLTYKARAKLRKVSQAIIGSRLEGLRKQQAEDARTLRAAVRESLHDGQAIGADGDEQQSKQDESAKHLLDPGRGKTLDAMTEKEFVDKLAEETERVRKQGFIPSYRKQAATSSALALEPSAKRQRTDDPPPPSQRSAQQSAFDREVARGLGENEELITTEVPVTTKNIHLWPPNTRARKPRYFNRVITGYEWNKYNQTHYDHDNPPPKVVQGYKFNIFYPDLLPTQTAGGEVVKAPTYKIEREQGRRRGEVWAPAGEDDTCVIRFVAGAPYEDIAFHIVDKEWDYSAKRERGFRSSFDKGILQLHFQFKKIYYRK